jgi:hypothetical protein
VEVFENGEEGIESSFANGALLNRLSAEGGTGRGGDESDMMPYLLCYWSLIS